MPLEPYHNYLLGLTHVDYALIQYLVTKLHHPSNKRMILLEALRVYAKAQPKFDMNEFKAFFYELFHHETFDSEQQADMQKLFSQIEQIEDIGIPDGIPSKRKTLALKKEIASSKADFVDTITTKKPLHIKTTFNSADDFA